MSGFLPDLASWALGGGAGSGTNRQNDDENNTGDGNENGTSVAPEPATTEAEMRARRLARMEATQLQQQQHHQQPVSQDPQPMEIDDAAGIPSSVTKAATADSVVSPMQTEWTISSPKKVAPPNEPALKKVKNVSPATDPGRKLQRKKELLIKKVLNITMGSTPSDRACIPISLDDNGSEIGVHVVAELLATRLSMPLSALSSTMPGQKPLISYLASSHRKAADEAKTLRQSLTAKKQDSNAPLLEILQEIQNQVVSYASSSLMEPDLFEQAADSQRQLLEALIQTNGDPVSSISFGVAGQASSFYHQLCDELSLQDGAAFEKVITGLATSLMKQLNECDNIDSAASADTSAIGLVSVVQTVCSHKKAALAIAQMTDFLVPPPGDPAANELIRPARSGGTDLIRMLAGENRPYKKRSGVAVEKNTLLGLVLRISTPKINPAFPPTNILRQSISSVEQASNQQRQQLRIYQGMCTQLLLSFVKAGPPARNRVMAWFTDCLLVNTGATAMRPDPTKVSNSAMLLNVSVVLLKLCEPFVLDEGKHHLIDPGFVSSPTDSQGVFPTRGDDALPRLGEADSEGMAVTSVYEPKNAFIPQCFFFAARSLALAIVPMLSLHENLLRHISHQHWELSNQNQDVQSDPNFCILVSRQRSSEVALFQEEMIVDTLRFCNLMAKVLYNMDDDSLRRMPEHFVDNVCDIMMSVAKLKPQILRGMEFRSVFEMVVKLLSPIYASMVRNYNLRAMLGDVLHDLYLPSDVADHRRDIPSSVALDPMMGGRSYLLSNHAAQEILAPSLLLLYGEVEHTGYYDKMSHRAKISSLLKYLWESKEHRPAFQKITQNKESFIKFANGIINETNTLIATVMQKLPEIRSTQERMGNAAEWGRLTEEEQSIATSRLDDNEREVKHALPLCNKTLQMFGYLNTDGDIRSLFLLPELCPRLVNMLIHVLGKLVGSKGLDLKVSRETLKWRSELKKTLLAIHSYSDLCCRLLGQRPGTVRVSSQGDVA
jgi:ubiquitin conjugation factor E4 B